MPTSGSSVLLFCLLSSPTVPYYEDLIYSPQLYFATAAGPTTVPLLHYTDSLAAEPVPGELLLPILELSLFDKPLARWLF